MLLRLSGFGRRVAERFGRLLEVEWARKDKSEVYFFFGSLRDDEQLKCPAIQRQD